MGMQGRNYTAEAYRFGYQGSEKETGVNGMYTTEFRALDVRLGRWFMTDPIVHEWQSPYTSMDNDPISLIDEFGLDSEGGGTGTQTGSGNGFMTADLPEIDITPPVSSGGGFEGSSMEQSNTDITGKMSFANFSFDWSQSGSKNTDKFSKTASPAAISLQSSGPESTKANSQAKGIDSDIDGEFEILNYDNIDNFDDCSIAIADVGNADNGLSNFLTKNLDDNDKFDDSKTANEITSEAIDSNQDSGPKPKRKKAIMRWLKKQCEQIQANHERRHQRRINRRLSRRHGFSMSFRIGNIVLFDIYLGEPVYDKKWDDNFPGKTRDRWFNKNKKRNRVCYRIRPGEKGHYNRNDSDGVNHIFFGGRLWFYECGDWMGPTHRRGTHAKHR